MIFEIKHKFSFKILFSGEFKSIKDCLVTANLQGANLQYANLQDADLQDANLQGADLRGADLRCANLDFSCLHLACKTFNVKWSDKHIFQFIAHITRSNVENLSDNAREAILALDKWKNDFCNYRTDIKKI